MPVEVHELWERNTADFRSSGRREYRRVFRVMNYRVWSPGSIFAAGVPTWGDPYRIGGDVDSVAIVRKLRISEPSPGVFEIEVYYSTEPEEPSAEAPPTVMTMAELKAFVQGVGSDGGTMFTAEGGFRNIPSEN